MSLKSQYLLIYYKLPYLIKSVKKKTNVLTKIRIVEEDELLPAVFRHHLHDDLIEIHGWTDHEGVVVCSGHAAGWWTGRTGCSRRGALDEEVGNVHGVGQSLKAACRHAPDRADQSQDTSIHQFTGCRDRKRKKKRRGYSTSYL